MDGTPIIGDLCAEVELRSLPDEVNELTWRRLQKFFTDELNIKMEVPRMIVRQVVEAMFRFKSSSCLCWQVYKESRLDRCSSLPRLQQVGSAQLEVERVAARCAKSVIMVVDHEALPLYQQHVKEGKKGALKQLIKGSKVRLACT